MTAFISSSPPLTMSVSRGRSGRMMYDPYQPQHLVRRTGAARYTAHLMGHLYNLCSSFRLDRKCKSLLPRLPEQRTPWIYGSLVAMKLSNMLHRLCIEFAEVVIRHPQRSCWHALVMQNSRRVSAVLFPKQTLPVLTPSCTCAIILWMIMIDADNNPWAIFAQNRWFRIQLLYLRISTVYIYWY